MVGDDPYEVKARRRHDPVGVGGRALAGGGLLFVVATLLHPSQETPITILETEARLVGSHAVYVVSSVLILLGLSTTYASARRLLGRMGSTGFFVTFAGTALLAISSQFGFIAPVLAAEAPTTLDSIIEYPPVVAFNVIAVVAFMAGYVILGTSIASSGELPRWPGILIAVGAPVHLVGFGVAQLAAPQLWFIAVLGSVALGAGLASWGRWMLAEPAH